VVDFKGFVNVLTVVIEWYHADCWVITRFTECMCLILFIC